MRDKKYQQHIQHPIALLRSPAMRVLSRAGHKILMCIESKLCRHGGKDNGKLPVTDEMLEDFGVPRSSVGSGLREVEGLGLAFFTERGRGGNAEYRRPRLVGLTYLPTGENREIAPTNEWSAIAAVEDAEFIVSQIRTKKTFSTPKNRGETHPQKQGRKPPIFTPKNRGGKPDSPPPKTGVLSRLSSHVVEGSEGVEEWQRNAKTPSERLPDDDVIPTFLRRGHPDCKLGN